MKKLLLILACMFIGFGLKAQDTTSSENICFPYYYGKDYVVVAINAKTTDKELLEIRKNILKYTSIRFTNFDVIRGKNGDIYFLSMAVDCRDGFKGDISHSFEPGDESYYGFIRDYTKDPSKLAFYIGDLHDEKSCLKRVEDNVAKAKLEQEKDN